MATLPELDDLPSFLEILLAEALQVAGSEDGAVVLLEGEPGEEAASYVTVFVGGRSVDLDGPEGADFGPRKVVAGTRAFIDRIVASEQGVTTFPEDSRYSEEDRRYMSRRELRSIYSIGMRVDRKVVGWLSAAYRDVASPSSDRIALLCALAELMTMAVELTRMAERSRRAAIARERAAAAQARVERIVAGNRILTGAIEALAAEPVVDAMLSYVLRAICEQHYGETALGSLWLVDEERGVARRHLLFVDGKVVPTAGSGFVWEDQEQPLRFLTSKSFVSGAPVRVPVEQLEEEQASFLRERGVRDIVFFPMSLVGRLVGLFALCLPVGRSDPSEEDLHFSQALVQQATLAMHLTRLADEARSAAVAREREEAAQTRVGELVRANSALRRSLDLIAGDSEIGDTHGRLLQVVSEQIDCPASTFCLRDETSGEFRVDRVCVDGVIGHATAGSAHARICPEPESRFWQMLVVERRAVALEPGDASASDLREWFESSGARLLVVVPMLLRGDVVGCFTFRFEAPAQLSVERLELLQTLSHQATLSVQLERLALAAQSKSQRAATLAERARIARDLHDTLAQGLTGILMHLHASERTPEWTEARSHVHAALEAARGALVDASRSVYALRSFAAERPEFTAALRSILKTTFAGSDVALDVSGSADLGGVAEAVETELLRIAQEAATNSLKHARATRFDVRVAVDEKSITLDFADNGAGFDTAMPREGFGLVGMAERAARAGAALTVVSEPGAGTRIDVTLPRATSPRTATVRQT